jgi:hypothetical protein
VVINISTSPKSQTFTFSNDSVAHVMRYTTSETKNPSYDGIIDLADSSFTTTLEGKSITTFISTEVSSGIEPLFASVPQSYSLEQNYPNPFNPVTTVSYPLGKPSEVKINVYDLCGHEVAIRVNGMKPAGTHTIRFDGTDLTSGIYFYKLQAADQVITRKMMFIK